LTGTTINAAAIGNSGATLTGTLQTAAQTNITSLGTLTGLTLSGTLNGTTVQAATIGNAGAAFIGNGSQLTSLTGANVTGTVANATYADSAGSAASATSADSATLAEYVTQSAQANITSVGSSLTTAEITIGSNAITSTHHTITIEPADAGSTGNVVIEGNLRVTGNVTYIDSETITTNDKDIMVANNQTTSLGIDGAGIIAGNVSNVGIATFTYDHSTTSWQPNVGITPAANASLDLGGTSNYWNNGYFAAITAPSITGTLQTAAQTNITSVGTLTGLTLSGTLTGTTINAAAIGNSGATLTGTIQTAAQTNITSVGTLTGLTLSGTLTGTTINAAAIGNSGATLTGTIQTAAQTNITSVGTLTGLTLSGTLTGTTVEAAQIGNSGATLTGTLDTAAQTNITSVGTLTGLTLSGALLGTTVGTSGNATVNGLTVNTSATVGTTLGVTGNATVGGILTDNYYYANGSPFSPGGGGGTTTVSNTAPSSPSQGDIWIDSDSAIQYIYFSDGDSSQWAEMQAELSFGQSSYWLEKTGNYTAVSGDWLIVNTASSAITITLPASPSLGDTVKIVDGSGNAATNNITVDRNTNNINGTAANLTIDIDRASVEVVYYDTTNGWILIGT
jgi:hypothetical protein